jgi:hypothetical protein
MRPTAPLALLTACAVTACSGDKGGPAGDSGASSTPRGDCNPVDPGHCMFPFPSSFFLEADASAPSGQRVRFGPGSLPTNRDLVQMTPDAWNTKDGFPILGAMVALLPGVSTDGAAGWDEIERSLAADSPTVVLDAATGERIPHFVELERFTDDPARRALILRPVVPLGYDRDIVVGLRGLVDSTGAPVDAPAPFVALRDGGSTDDPDLERQRPRYEDVVFPALAAAGVDRAELQLAWDFHTTSADGSLGPILHMRDEALALVGDGGPAYTIRESSDFPCDGGGTIGRRLYVDVEVPLYLSDWNPGPQSRLLWGADGQPEPDGTASVPMTVQIPCTLLQDPRPGALLQFGHGLFGDQGHSESSSMGRIAQQGGFVLYAVDWTGMKAVDAPYAGIIMSDDPSNFASLTDRLHQAHVEGFVATRLMQTGLAADPALQVDGVSLINPSEVLYFGTSMGGILGGAHLAMSPTTSRAVLNVPGAPFTLLLTRSAPFEPFFAILEAKYTDPADITALLALTQMLWDPTEGGGWAPFMGGTPVDSVVPPTREVLVVDAIGDRSVTTLGAHVVARAVGATNMEPLLREVWGLPSAAPPFSGPALLEMDFGYEEPTDQFDAEPGIDAGPHELPFSSREAQELSAHFLSTGEVISVCEGTCDPR